YLTWLEQAGQSGCALRCCRSRAVSQPVPASEQGQVVTTLPRRRNQDTPSSDQRAVPLRHTGWAELALGIGSFGIGTGEFVIMGLLPNVAGNLGISVIQAGHAISAYALGVVIGAPLI